MHSWQAPVSCTTCYERYGSLGRSAVALRSGLRPSLHTTALGKFLPVQELVPKPAVERFTVGVLPRASRGDVQILNPAALQPPAQGEGNEFRAIVASQVRRRAPLLDQPGYHLNSSPLNGSVAPRGSPAPSGCVHPPRQDLQSATLPGLVLDEVIAPNLLGTFGPQPLAALIRCAQAGPFLGLPAHLQPFFSHRRCKLN